MHYRRWCMYSVLFQSGALTLFWAGLVIMLGITEYYGNHTDAFSVVALAILIFSLGCLITAGWPLLIIRPLKNDESPLSSQQSETSISISIILWWIVNLPNIPIGLLLSLFQIWCLWQDKKTNADINSQKDK